MACSMHGTALKFVRASILAARPGISVPEFRREIFLRMYGRDFAPEKRERIARAIADFGDR